MRLCFELDVTNLVFDFASGGILASRATIDKRRADKADNDHPPTHLLVPVSSQGLSLPMFDEKNAKGHRVYIWYNLVGIWP